MENRKPDTISYFDHEEQMARENLSPCKIAFS